MLESVMGSGFVLVALALMAGALLAAWQRLRTVFVLRIVEARVVSVRGAPPPGFAAACEDVCRLYRVERGEVRGVRARGTVSLRFSSEIPARARQPLRNVWTPPPGGGGGGGARARA